MSADADAPDDAKDQSDGVLDGSLLYQCLGCREEFTTAKAADTCVACGCKFIVEK